MDNLDRLATWEHLVNTEYQNWWDTVLKNKDSCLNAIDEIDKFMHILTDVGFLYAASALACVEARLLVEADRLKYSVPQILPEKLEK